MSSRKKSKGRGSNGGSSVEAKTKAGSSGSQNEILRETGEDVRETGEDVRETGEDVRETGEDVRENGGDVRVRGGGGLKGFVKKMDGQTHRMVEMRLAVVVACGVAFRVLLYDSLEKENEDRVVRSALSLVAVSVLVVILATWVDYFPSRLSHLQLRGADGQGMALGCLLVPTLLCSIVHCSLYTSPQVTNLLSSYLLVLCVLSLLSLFSTLLHSIPSPNNITAYNFVALATSFAAYYWLNVPYWLLVPCVVLYSCLVPWLLSTFPGSFSLGEAMIIGQGLSLLTTDTGLQILDVTEVVHLPEMFLVHRNQSLLYVEYLVFGILMCCVLLSPALHKLSQAKSYVDHKFWSGTFILLSLGMGVLTVLRWLQTQLLGLHPIALVVMETFTKPSHLVLMIFWVMVTGLAVLLVTAQNPEKTWLAPLRFQQRGSLWMRKSFHLLAVLVFLPSLSLSSHYISLASSISLFLFCVLELLRYFRMWPGGGSLHSSLLPLTDSRDAGSLILSHIYLLLGFSLPLWLSPLGDQHNVGKLSLYSGVLSVGVGDSMAAVAGTLMGKTHWPGTKKTVEGSAMSILTQLLVVLAIVVIDPHIFMPTLREWGIVGGSVVATAIMEAYTGQIDNLIIPLFQLAFFLSFL